MGSSLTVTPAADFPRRVGKKKTLVIVNLQKTPIDEHATLRINAKCDDVMRLLMKELKLDVPEWCLVRHAKLKVDENSTNSELTIHFEALEPDGTPLSIFKALSLNTSEETKTKKPDLQTALLSGAEFTSVKFKQTVKSNTDNKEEEKKEDKVEAISLELEFVGNYNEPSLSLDLGPYLNTKFPFTKILKLVYNPFVGFFEKYVAIFDAHDTQLILSCHFCKRQKPIQIATKAILLTTAIGYHIKEVLFPALLNQISQKKRE
ncbi:transcriptional regulator, Sir2 family protein [Reticulomyxa filosa]|uniref:Transcriptional regulator, Sir2 family protein n=1 Tax=Reticulomyxa filosa TaxID=46433 RepID=X6MD73_RETFI|nr:transcriptional regulator, Sir2 family protein [Reticulomyxa filosa]|eukprot:ETO11626.1 transcriptional regulator, Sir2 family protein [Reticulomyxa filosa]